jgi:Rad3-related DNA helicase
MAKDSSHDLDQVAQAVRRKKLAAEDIRLLREKIAALNEAGTEHRFVKAALRNLKVAGTQLKDIAERNKSGEPFDEAAFEQLPEHLRKRILKRLDNIAQRMADASHGGKPLDYSEPAFRCLRDYETCRREARISPLWCQLAMVVCLLRSVLSLPLKIGSK